MALKELRSEVKAESGSKADRKDASPDSDSKSQQQSNSQSQLQSQSSVGDMSLSSGIGLPPLKSESKNAGAAASTLEAMSASSLGVESVVKVCKSRANLSDLGFI